MGRTGSAQVEAGPLSLDRLTLDAVRTTPERSVLVFDPINMAWWVGQSQPQTGLFNRREKRGKALSGPDNAG